MMWMRRAPTAIRMPISRVRSVTLTSMIFMIPIPPTSSEIDATVASRIAITWLARLGGLRNLVQAAHRKVVVLTRLDSMAVVQNLR